MKSLHSAARVKRPNLRPSFSGFLLLTLLMIPLAAHAQSSPSGRFHSKRWSPWRNSPAGSVSKTALYSALGVVKTTCFGRANSMTMRSNLASRAASRCSITSTIARRQNRLDADRDRSTSPEAAQFDCAGVRAVHQAAGVPSQSPGIARRHPFPG